MTERATKLPLWCCLPLRPLLFSRPFAPLATRPVELLHEKIPARRRKGTLRLQREAGNGGSVAFELGFWVDRLGAKGLNRVSNAKLLSLYDKLKAAQEKFKTRDALVNNVLD